MSAQPAINPQGAGSTPRREARSKARPDGGRVLERFLDMMQAIPRHPHWISTAEVHKRLEALGYEVDRRTVVRDLNKLSEQFGVERHGEPAADGKRTALAYQWRWPEKSAGIHAPLLTEFEALTLVMVRDHLGALLPPMVNEALRIPFIRADKKLRNMPNVAAGGLKHWNDSVRVVQPTQPLLPPKVGHAVREAIYLALATRSQFTGWYRRRGATESREATYHPLGLIVRGQVTYLVATMWEYTDVLVLPLHRFERVLVRDDRRREPAGFDLDRFVAAQSGLGFATGVGDIQLTLRFRNGVGEHLYETALAADQEIKDLGNGVHEVTATVPDTGQLRWWLLGFGAGVEVLAPATLREEIASTVRDTLRRYEQEARA